MELIVLELREKEKGLRVLWNDSEICFHCRSNLPKHPWKGSNEQELISSAGISPHSTYSDEEEAYLFLFNYFMRRRMKKRRELI